MPLPRLPERVQIVEVGPRDGLQNEPAVVPTAQKVAFIERLAAAGHTIIESGSFVSPKWVPQLGDTAEVFATIAKTPGVRYTALVPNAKGLERAIAAGVTEIAIFAAASESFSRRNINQSIDDAMTTYAEVCRHALTAGVRVRGYLSVCFGCPFEGDVPPERVAELSARLLEMGAYEVSVSDTIGIAHPGQVSAVVDVVSARIGLRPLALHFHDTRGTALANVLAGLIAGVTVFDASCGGLGGCPFSPGATGNLATEDLVYALDGLGVATGVSLDALVDASLAIEPHVAHAVPSRYVQAVRKARESVRRAAGPAPSR